MDDGGRLDEQLRALEQACARHDAGDRTATPELAAPLRAIFHQGGGHESLLARAGGRFIHLLSTAAENPKNRPAACWPGLLAWDLDPASMVLVASAKRDLTKKADHPVAVSYWWESEPVYQAEHLKVRRRDLVLHAANRAGGPAAAEDLPAKYRDLLDAAAWRATLRPPGAAEREALLYHAAAASLRQVAYEVLHSPELLKLAGRKA